jgi:hypothetical protein
MNCATKLNPGKEKCITNKAEVMKMKIKLSKKELGLLIDIVGHCDDHCDWMIEVLDNGELMSELLGKLATQYNAS